MRNAAIENLIVTDRDCSFVTALLNARDHPQKGTRLSVIAGSGALAGSFGGGINTGLEKAGVLKAVKVAIGVSSGAPNVAYPIADQGELGRAIYWELLPAGFINPLRLGKIVDIDVLEKFFLGKIGNRKLDTEKVKNARTKLLVTATNIRTGQGELFDLQDPQIDVVTAITASCTMPFVYNKSRCIKGQDYIDGAIGLSLPVDEAVEHGELKSGDVLLVQLNWHPDRHHSPARQRLENVLAQLYFGNHPDLKRAITTRHKRLNNALSRLPEIASRGINVGIICPPRELHLSEFETSPTRLKQLSDAGLELANNLFAR